MGCGAVEDNQAIDAAPIQDDTPPEPMRVTLAQLRALPDGRPARPAVDVPSRRDRALDVPVEPRAPCDLFRLHDLLQLLAIRIAVDSEEHEGLVGEAFHERPLVWVHGPAGASPRAPEVEDHHLSAEVAELHGLPIDVLAFDFRSDLTDLEVP